MEKQINTKQNEDGNKDGKTNHEENLKSKVFDLIERDKIKPKSKLYFVIKDKAFWSLFVLSVIIGSIAVSVMIFSFTNSESDIYEVTHDGLVDFVLEITPYMWFLLFATFAFVGYENIRHTDKGYKYSFGIVLLSSLVLNIAGGITLHELGLSKIIDQDISANNMFVKSSDFNRRMRWNQPDRGILSGEVVSFSSSSSTFILRDFNGSLWVVSYNYIPKISQDLISTSSEIRIIGVSQKFGIPSTSGTSSVIAVVQESSSTASQNTGSVVACYILPWNTNEYSSGISKIKESLINTNNSERNISDKRNNNCRTVKAYNIIREMVESK